MGPTFVEVDCSSFRVGEETVIGVSVGEVAGVMCSVASLCSFADTEIFSAGFSEYVSICGMCSSFRIEICFSEGEFEVRSTCIASSCLQASASVLVSDMVVLSLEVIVTATLESWCCALATDYYHYFTYT